MYGIIYSNNPLLFIRVGITSVKLCSQPVSQRASQPVSQSASQPVSQSVFIKVSLSVSHLPAIHETINGDIYETKLGIYRYCASWFVISVHDGPSKEGRGRLIAWGRRLVNSNVRQPRKRAKPATSARALERAASNVWAMVCNRSAPMLPLSRKGCFQFSFLRAKTIQE